MLHLSILYSRIRLAGSKLNFRKVTKKNLLTLF
jgi:hypothetical protein